MLLLYPHYEREWFKSKAKEAILNIPFGISTGNVMLSMGIPNPLSTLNSS